MDKTKINFKSIVGICTCIPPRTGKFTKTYPDGRKEVTLVGDFSLNCKWCGKPWKDHKQAIEFTPVTEEAYKGTGDQKYMFDE